MSSARVRMLGKRASGASRTLALAPYNSRAGALKVALLRPALNSYALALGASWIAAAQGTEEAPVLVRRLEAANPSGAALSLRLALRESAGTPGSADAVLAWDTVVAANSVWVWEGELALAGGWLYARASASGLSLLVVVEA